MRHPNHSPLSWTLIRNFAEKFTWQDPSDGSTYEGFNPPPSAVNKQRKPFFIRFITRDGKTEAGRVVTLTVDGQKHQRKVNRKPRKSGIALSKYEREADILSYLEELENNGLLSVVIKSHRVLIAHSCAAQFAGSQESFKRFLRGVSLYATYKFTNHLTTEAIARAELDMLAKRRKEKGSDLTHEEELIVTLQAREGVSLADIQQEVYFDMVVVAATGEPLVIAQTKGEEVEVVAVFNP
ncbi:unnamed protein product [Cylicocyclus nassatus]|uniref:Uncharacterized protein n=1 Tax=Cylicocyclus nassatus TaxID=53992 RepID=A0AA36DT09_CYLNA|nr:unnamed protein product [Cylicocyclus nassatus]